jgi:hypothetical protein
MSQGPLRWKVLAHASMGTGTYRTGHRAPLRAWTQPRQPQSTDVRPHVSGVRRRSFVSIAWGVVAGIRWEHATLWVLFPLGYVLGSRDESKPVRKMVWRVKLVAELESGLTTEGACKAVGFITRSMRLLPRRVSDGSLDSDDGQRPRAYRSAPLFARRGRAAPSPCSSTSAVSCSCAWR